jgi:hypothetical protein
MAVRRSVGCPDRPKGGGEGRRAANVTAVNSLDLILKLLRTCLGWELVRVASVTSCRVQREKWFLRNC